MVPHHLHNVVLQFCILSFKSLEHGKDLKF